MRGRKIEFGLLNREWLWGKALLILLIWLPLVPGLSARDRAQEQAARIVGQIQRADYEGDRTALKRLYDELAPFAKNQDIAARVEYWRGFALWRRTINGFNDKVEPTALQEDLRQAIDEFDRAVKLDPDFVDAKIGKLSCLGLLAFATRQQDPGSTRVQQLIGETRQLWKDVEPAAQANPRFFWVIGPMVWNTPPERAGGQTKAIEGYEKGLDAMRNHKAVTKNPLEPSWGEPELLMSLAWSNLNRTTPDVKVAEQYAQSALDLVPDWHYVRDILMPQIQNAKKKQG